MKNRNALKIIIATLVFGALGASEARTKLTTLPERDMIRIDLRGNSQALAEEERTVNLQKGKNRVEFAWAGARIHKDSIQIRPIRSPGKVAVINVNYPPGEQALFWEVYSQKAGPAIFRISYLIANIRRVYSYEAIVDRAEKTMLLKSYFTLSNMSGEKFKNAHLSIRFGKGTRKTLRAGEARKILAARFKNTPFVKAYRYDRRRTGKHVRMYYEIKNSGGKLGKQALPSGKARVYQTDSSGGEAFIGEDWGRYTPRGKTMSLFMGLAREVKVKRVMYRSRKVYTKKPVYDRKQVIRFQVENFKDAAVPLKLREHPGGEWTLDKIVLKEETGERNEKKERVVSHAGKVRTKRIDVHNLETIFHVPPTRNKKYNLYLHLTLKNRW